MTPTLAALLLSAAVAALGVGTGWVQLQGARDLKRRAHVPSDEAAYLRSRYRRRFLTGAVLVLIAALIAGFYLSGLYARANALAPPPGEGPGDGGAPRELAEGDRQFLQLIAGYWGAVIALVFALVGLAFTDALASRRYWYRVYRELRDEHNARLRRDLAVYKQQQSETRNGRFKPPPAPSSAGES